MKVYRGNIKDFHSCNCCSRGKINEDGMGLKYPYDEVTVMEGTTISIRMCDDCLNEFKSLI